MHRCISRPPRATNRHFHISGQLNRNAFLWCRCPSRPASWSTDASDIIFMLLDVFYRLNLDLTSLSLIFLCLFKATKGGLVHICLSVSSLSTNCQLFLSILPISIDALSYGMTKGRFLAVCVVCLLVPNSKSGCEYCLTLLNCVFISERL